MKRIAKTMKDITEIASHLSWKLSFMGHKSAVPLSLLCAFRRLLISCSEAHSFEGISFPNNPKG